jgi:hypothetical protein
VVGDEELGRPRVWLRAGNSGQINGQGNYGFMLSARDGQRPGGGGSDKFRIKIWDKATDTVVYDNQMGADEIGDPTTVIGGGSIVVHN